MSFSQALFWWKTKLTGFLKNRVMILASLKAFNGSFPLRYSPGSLVWGIWNLWWHRTCLMLLPLPLSQLVLVNYQFGILDCYQMLTMSWCFEHPSLVMVFLLLLKCFPPPSGKLLYTLFYLAFFLPSANISLTSLCLQRILLHLSWCCLTHLCVCMCFLYFA